MLWFQEYFIIIHHFFVQVSTAVLLSCAVETCAKFGGNRVIDHETIACWNSNHIWIVSKIALVKRAPGPWGVGWRLVCSAVFSSCPGRCRRERQKFSCNAGAWSRSCPSAAALQTSPLSCHCLLWRQGQEAAWTHCDIRGIWWWEGIYPWSCWWLLIISCRNRAECGHLCIPTIFYAQYVT